MALLLVVPFLTFAREYVTPSGVKIQIEEPRNIIWKEFTLPSGIKYVAMQLLPIARAADLSLKEEIEIWIRYQAGLFKIDEDKFLKLAICESGLDPNAINDKEVKGGLSIGLYQWQQHSWNFYNKKYGWELDRNHWQDQIMMSGRVLQEKNGWTNWINCWSFIKYGTWDKTKWKPQ